MSSPVAGSCRLVVRGPSQVLEVAVPAQALVADLLPVLLTHLGDDVAEQGLDHGGWCLQRLGGEPLDEDRSVAEHELHDGETVYLRPASERLPAVHFDDLVDGLATGLRSRAGLWTPGLVSWTAAGLLLYTVALGLLVLALPGSAATGALAAAGSAVECLVLALVVARSADPQRLLFITGAGAIAFAALAGFRAPEATGAPPPGPVHAIDLLCAAAAALVCAALVAAAQGGVSPPLVAAMSASALTAGGAALTVFTTLTVAQAAAIVAVASTVLAEAVPLLAFRMTGLRLVPLPTGAEELQRDIDPEPGDTVLADAARVDRYMTALSVGGAAVSIVALVLTAGGPGWAPAVLVVLVASTRLLSARAMTSAWHRLAVAVPAFAGLTVVALAAAADAPPAARAGVVVVAFPLAAMQLLRLSRSDPQRRAMPHWGRAGDLLQSATMIAVFPVLLAVLGVYGDMLAIGG
ncbi:type VII secretion integral membrane protein EccD [Dactylosporangium sp. CA-092794]|uniref:type VII secretion integral membrane protein EccD n=1 Tax=Dactylosporangium sp. CA-092794 TaxID=3239929 RepID=UPI003D8F17E2